MTTPDRRHPASLLPPSLHNPQLVQLMTERVNLKMVVYVAHQASKVIRTETEEQIEQSQPPLISLEKFIVQLVKGSNVQVSALLTTLIYFERLKSKLPPMAKGLPCTRHRMFLAALIVAAKYLNDSSPKNIHWAQYAVLFDVAEINLMEQQFLYLLDYDLRFDEAEACSLFAPFMLWVSRQDQVSKARTSAVDKVAKAGRARAQAQQAHSQVQVTVHRSPSLSPRPSQPVTKSASLTVASIVKKLSSTRLASRGLGTPAVTLSNRSASSSSSSSDMASLLEDTGSSSGWTSNDSSDCSEDEHIRENTCEAGFMDEDAGDTTITLATSQLLSVSRSSNGNKRSFKLRSMPSTCAYKHAHQKTRKASDTSSINTITASPPTLESVPTSSSTSSFLFPLRGPAGHQRLCRRDSKRAASLSDTPSIGRKGRITESLIDPSIPCSVSANMATSTTGNFLSRIWVAATAGKTQSNQNIGQPPAPGTLGRLVHSRSTVFTQANVGRASHAVEV